MKKVIVFMAVTVFACSGVFAQIPRNYYTMTGFNYEPTIQIAELSDVLFSATSRFGVTPNLPGLFTGMSQGGVLSIPAGTSQTFTIDFTTKGEVAATGITYPEGYVYVGFFFIYGPQSISGRAMDKDGVWHNVQDWTNISSNASVGTAFYAGMLPANFNFMTKLEVTITAPVSDVSWITKIEYHPTKQGYELKPAYVSKSIDNKLYSKFDFVDATNTIKSYIHPDGNGYFGGMLGIGTDNPTYKLDVNGNVRTLGLVLPTGASAGKVLTSDAGGNASWQTASGGSTSGWAFNGSTVGSLTKIGTTDNFDLPLITNGTEKMRITTAGFVGINTAHPQGELAVNGTIYSKKVKVTQLSWADYVFEKNYHLPDLKEVARYIRQNKHLPDVPSAAEVEKQGIDLGDNQAILLKKIEELTLYLIEDHKKMEAQQQLLLEQQKKIEALEKKIQTR
jgi:hypothetical protein